MITTLKITLLRNLDWSANIELEESSTLEDLHLAIQSAVRFGNDHLYCFYMSRTDRSRSRETFDDENGLIFSQTLKDLFPLQKHQSLFYHFDFGDDWYFKISPTRKRPHEPVSRKKYPRVESESGTRPVQYPM